MEPAGSRAGSYFARTTPTIGGAERHGAADFCNQDRRIRFLIQLKHVSIAQSVCSFERAGVFWETAADLHCVVELAVQTRQIHRGGCHELMITRRLADPTRKRLLKFQTETPP